MVGINRFDGKDKRRQRLRNHIAKDLKSDKYHQRVIPGRKHIGREDEHFFVEIYLEDSDDQ